MRNTYSWSKNLLMVLLALIALLYALPNVYNEDPVIQISAKSTEMSREVVSQVKKLLKGSNIPYTGMSQQDDSVTVRFSSPDLQLHARDVVSKQLGSEYTVALNLLPSTPEWLRHLGALPMKQGLDLRGGVHFLLEVDVNSVVVRRYEGLMKSIAQDLREKGIRYSGIRMIPDKGIDIRFRDATSCQDALALIGAHNPDLILNNAEASSDTASELFVSLSDMELSQLRQNTIEQTMSILRNRVNELGVGEAVVQQQGATRIAVDLPGIQDATRAKQILGGTATLQFYLVDAEHDPIVARQSGAVPVNSKLYTMNGHPILLKRQVVLNGDSITSAISSFDSETAQPAVSIQLGGGGEALFTQTTRNNIGKRMAILYVESRTISETLASGEVTHTTKRDEKVISAPVIQSALGNNFQITGLTSMKEAQDLALLLRAGALPTAIYPIEERTVGPSLGRENIRRGIVSLVVGMGLILFSMAVYYRLFGWIANMALVLNLIFLTAVLSILEATLTLSGIAGIVLTVGMAVDANVLIYERIREELRAGFSPQAAIFAGYERAFATIMDANITTLIVALVLFSIGTGPVRGFAITLSLGLLTSMLTGVTYTRAMVNLIYGRRNVKKLSIGL